MNRKCSRCGNNGLNSKTCNEKGLKLFGGRSLGEGDDITRKSKSKRKRNLSFYFNSSNGFERMTISMVSSTEEHDTGNQGDCIRGVVSDFKYIIQAAADGLGKNGFINYFGLQRFGSRVPTHLIGMALLRGEWKWLHT